MRIGIDCRLAGTEHAGIGRYVQNLLRHILPKADHQWVLFFYSQEQADKVLAEINASNIKVVLVPVRHYTISEQLAMPGVFQREKLDLLHVPHFNAPIFYSGKLIVTIHDLLWHHRRGADVTTLGQFQYWIKYVFYRLVVRLAVMRAKHIIVPAETVKKTVIEYFQGAKDKIAVTYEGIDDNLMPADKIKGQNSAVRESNVLLYVGSLYPHKNIRLVIAALHKLPKLELHLAGSRNIFSQETMEFARSLGLEKRVKLLGYLSDKKLKEKYLNVKALIQPSLSEGFGLTGVEAMALGTPVLASDIPIFREIYQDGAIYFDPYKVNSFVDAVGELDKSSEKLAERSQEIAGLYSWDKMADQTLRVYENQS